MNNWRRILPVTLALAAVTACEQVKSENPLSPLIAGPIAGVEITTPVLLEPAMNRQFKPDQQPVTLVFENPTSNSPRPYTFRVDVAADAGFTTPVFTRSGIVPGTTGGRTSVTLPEPLAAGRVYYWRTKAEDGANSSAHTSAQAFEILEPVIIGAPTPRTPIGNLRLTTRRPTLTVTNAVSSGPHGPLTYIFEVALDTAFGSRVVFEQAAQGVDETSLTVPADLALNTTHYWRARVTNGEVTGNWSGSASFLTPLPVVVPVPGPGPGPQTPGNCATRDGDALVQCIADKYPSYLAAGVSDSQRHSNMEFLRDRIIEAGICGGLDLAWNKKRGDGPHSIDALAWRTSGGDEVVDIGVGFDDTSTTLRLQWAIVAGPPGYDTYSPRPNCG